MLQARKSNIFLLLLFVVSAVWTVYSLWTYDGGSTTTASTSMMQAGSHNSSFQEFQGGQQANRNGPAFGRSSGDTSAATTYETPLIIYSIFFFAIISAGYYLLASQRMKLTAKQHIIWILLGVGLLARIALAPWVGGHPFDVSLFKNWATAAANGLSSFYQNSSSDYPPFYIYILFLVGKAVSLSSLSSYFQLLIKVPSILADIVTAYILYKVASKRLSLESSLLLAAFYLFNPAIFINSVFWGQVDSFFTMLILLAILCIVSNKISLSAVVFAAAVLMKPQGIIFLPVLLFELVRLKSVKKFVAVAISSLVTAVIILLPFSSLQDPLWIFDLFKKTIGQYPYASMNAFNFFALIGANYANDGTRFLFLTYHTWGMLAIVAVTSMTWLLYIKRKQAAFASIAAMLQISGVFAFASGMHERYLFPAVALSLLAFIYEQDKRLLWLSAGFSASVFFNTHEVLYSATSGSAAYTTTLFFTSLLTVSLFIYAVKIAWDIAFERKRQAVIDSAASTDI